MNEADEIIEKLEALQDFLSAMPFSDESFKIVGAILRVIETKPNKSFCKRVLTELD